MKSIDLKEECDLLLGEIEKNCRKAKEMRDFIEKSKSRTVVALKPVDDYEIEEDYDDEIEESDPFEDEVEFYLEDYRDLDDDFIMEDLLDILPRRSNYSFNKILFRLQAESLKEIKELQEIIEDSKDASKEELLEYRKLIEVERKKIDYIKQILSGKEEKLEEQIGNNRIILMPTLYGNINVIEELKKIPSEYYPGFAELVQSVVDGSFKGVKGLGKNNRALKGISEVKGFKIRVVFSRVGRKTYALITAFVKKVDTSSHYKKSLNSKVRDYRTVYDNIKDNLDDPLFIEENENNVLELFRLLGMESEDIKEERKGGVK